MKRCGSCKAELPLSDFNRSTRSKDGRQDTCRECNNAAVRRWRARNPEYDRTYNARRPGIAEVPQDVAERRRQSSRESYWRARSKGLEYLLYKAERARRGAARAAGLEVDETTSYMDVLKRDGFTCYLCGGDVAEADLGFDHVIPFCRGGPHTPQNIRVCHRKCNARKKHRLPFEIPPGSILTTTRDRRA